MKNNSQKFADLSMRKSNCDIRFNNFTTDDPTTTNMMVYQSGHKFNCPPGWHTTVNTYDHYIIHYVLNGNGTYSSPSNCSSVKQGDLFLIKPFESIHYQADFLYPWTYYWVGFNGTDASHILKLCGFSDTNLIISHQQDSLLEEIFRKVAYPRRTSISREYELLGNLYQLFSYLIHTHDPQPISKSEQYLNTAVNYIQEKYLYSDLSVNDIAGFVGIDRTYLYRLFHKHFQLSVQDFILKIRLKKAANLLKYSDLSIELIAFYCGFGNQSYFSTVFKKNFSKSPLQYRKEALAAE